MHTRTGTLVAGVVAIALLAVRPAFAQGQDVRGDLAVGYSVLRDVDAHRTLPAGLVFAASAELNRKLRFVAEFGGNYKTVSVATGTNVSVQVLTYQGGLRFAPGQKKKTRIFAQILAGGARATQTLLGFATTTNRNGFVVQPGAGVDFRVSDRFDGRIQVDYRAIRSGGTTGGEYRFAFSIVFPFGG